MSRLDDNKNKVRRQKAEKTRFNLQYAIKHFGSRPFSSFPLQSAEVVNQVQRSQSVSQSVCLCLCMCRTYIATAVNEVGSMP